MKKTRKLNKLKVGIVIFLFIFTFSMVVFGRYIYNTMREAYFSARQFYFTSNLLKLGGANYTYDNWGGIGENEIIVDLYSYDNVLSKLEYDLNYTITCESLNPDKITCSIAGTENATTAQGTILKAANNTDTVTILVNAKEGVKIPEGDTVKVKVTARTEEPYKKEISCTFSLYVKLPEGNTYSIEDVAGRDYAILKLTNRSITTAEVTLTFDPEELRLDLNDEIYQNRVSVGTTTISGEKQYINKIIFHMEKESAKNVKFYKVDKTKNYSYPGVAQESAITVEY